MKIIKVEGANIYPCLFMGKVVVTFSHEFCFFKYREYIHTYIERESREKIPFILLISQ